MYRGRTWTVRQLAGFGTARDTNERYRFLLSNGATGINAVFDYPSLRAFDSDDPRALPDVGRGGVAVDVVADFEDLFAGIPIDSVSASLVSSQPVGAVPHLAMFLEAATRRGVSWSSLRGTSQNDFLMETCITIGVDALSPESSFRMECDLAEFSIEHLPRWNPVSVAGYNYREAGADAVLEVALSIAHARAVVEELINRGVDADEAAARITFFFAAHLNLFEEVAKFRAARRVWHRTTTDGLGCRSERGTRLRFHTQTAGTTFSAESPLSNIARGAIEALAAIAGGTQSLHVNGFDEAHAIPTERSAALALQTQHILLRETGVAASADPFGGSYLVEHLTDEIEAAILDTIACIDAAGGIVALVDNGWIHQELATRSYEHFAAAELEADHDAPDGVDDVPETTFVLPPDTAERQHERLAAARQGRDGQRVAKLLSDLERDAARGRNVLPATLEAVRAGATVGDVGRSIREACGTWTIPIR